MTFQMQRMILTFQSNLTMMRSSISDLAHTGKLHASVVSKFQIKCLLSMCKAVQKLEFIVEIVKFHTIFRERSTIVLNISEKNVENSRNAQRKKSFTRATSAFNALMDMLSTRRKERPPGRFNTDSFSVTLARYQI